MNIRRARRGEHRVLSEIARESKAHWGYSESDMAAWQDELTISPASIESRPTFIAEIDGNIVGFFQLACARERIEIDHFWVLPACMGRGVGRALLARAADEAALLGFSELDIDADPNASEFYLACGASDTGHAEAAPLQGDPERARPQLVLALNVAPAESVGSESTNLKE